MITFLTIIFMILVFFIGYFIKKKENKKYRNYTIIATVIIGIFIGILAPKNPAKNTTENIKETNPQEVKTPKFNWNFFKKNSKSSSKSSTKKKDEKNEVKEKNKNTQKENHEIQVSYAQTFGNKDAESIQNRVGTAYSSTTIDGNIAYGWHTDYGTLIRVDDSSSQLTSVFLYDETKTDGMGELLYQGHTIYQKAPKTYYYYN